MKRFIGIFFLVNVLVVFTAAQEIDYDKAVRTYRENKIDSAVYYIDKAIHLYTTQKKTDSLIFAKTQKVLAIWDRDGLNAAFQLMDSVLLIAEKLPPRSIAVVAAYSRMGQLYVQRHELDKAAAFYEKAENAIEVNAPVNRHYVLLKNYIAILHMLKSEYDSARKYSEEAYQMNLKLEGKDGFTMTSIFQIRYFINNYDEKYEAALGDGKEFQRLMMLHYPKNHPGIGTMHNSLAVVYETLRRYEEALYHRQKAVEIQQENYLAGSDGFSLASAWQNLGNLYQYINEPFLAQEYLQKGSRLLARTYGEDGPGMANILLDLAINKMKIGQYEEAGKLFERAYHIQQLHAPYNLTDLAYIEVFYGDFYRLQKNYPAAKIWYTRGLNNYKKAGNQQTELALKTKLDLAKLIALTGEGQQAIHLTKDISATFRQRYPAGNLVIAGTLHEISEVYAFAGKPDKAYAYSDSAFAELLKHDRNWKNDTGWVQKLPFSFQVLQYISGRIDILKRMYDHHNNPVHLKEILFLADQYKLFVADNLYSFRSQAALIDLADVNKKVFAQALEVCWILSDQGKNEQYKTAAFGYAEISKGLLLKLASNNLLIEEETGNNTLLARDQFFRKTIHTANLQYLNADRNDSLLSILSAEMENYRLFQDSLKKAENYSLALKNDITPVSVEEIRNSLLKKNETLLEYTITDESVFLFILTQTAFHLKKMDKSVLDKVTVLRNLYGLKADVFVENAYALYTDLILPAEQYFAGKKIYIVPDGELHYLNFELLLSDNKDKYFSEMRYLVKKYEISYLLSATSAVQFAKNKTRNEQKKLGLFTPVFTDEMKQNYFSRFTDQAITDEYYRYLLRQPFALNGSYRIAALVPNDMYVEQDAEERIFKEKAGDYKILHLGTHAEVNNSSPLQSRFFLAKAMPDDTLNTDDGYLHAYEIYSMQLKAELAVLSACETGSGSWRNGEGVVSLAHSFMYAGCPGVVMSLWKIDEKTSTDIVEKFYRYLAKGKSKSEALRKAKIDIISDGDDVLSHPYYWAGLALIGDTEPIYNQFSGYYSILVVGLLLLAGFLFYRRKRGRR